MSEAPTATQTPAGHLDQSILNEKTPERQQLDEALALLSSRKQAWVQVGIEERLRLLERLTQDFMQVMEAWVENAAGRYGQPTSRLRGEERATGHLVIIRMLVALKKSLHDIQRYGAPQPAGPLREHQGPQGKQTVLRLVPSSPYERLAYAGMTIDVRLQSGLAPQDVASSQAPAYKRKGTGKVGLVLGAGNVSSISVTDTLEKLFVHDEVVVLKLNPVNDYLADLIERAFGVLIQAGFVRVVKGGAEVGAYLCEHPLVESVHITGSGRTFDSIVFGAGEEGKAHKARREPKLKKPITAELGDISPVIVVPGPWSPQDLDYQAHHLASALTAFAGFTCATPRLLVQHQGWALRSAFLKRLERYLQSIPTRLAHYPGAQERWASLVEAQPESKRFGTAQDGELPWTLIPNLDPEQDSPCFTLEPFCGLASEVTLAGEDAASFINRAVDFVNERLWGSLSVTLLVHPMSLRAPEVAAALERAVDTLRYGTVSINQYTGISWVFATSPWGAYPGNEPWNAGSGIGFTHNPLMLTSIEKTVVRAPFRSFPAPVVFAGHKRYDEVIRHLIHLYAKPNPMRMMQLTSSVLRGWL